MLPSWYYLYIFLFCLERHKKYLIIGYENRCYLANLLSSKGLNKDSLKEIDSQRLFHIELNYV